MVKLHFASTDDKPKGVIVGSAWNVPKINGISIKFKGKTRNEAGELIELKGKLLEVEAGEGMLLLPNNRKREGKKDPDYTVLAYPKEKDAKKV